ncbi:tRNA pseudouridine synthase B [Corynebacterium kroppenstedtii]|uniref:tRNA pseudouridine synthase B n=1 Tax=Corynebacterium kroppenstedtii TaxID=161879 RepID=UPI0026E98999|nr:tRNA pseudouridine(55) synthase TruB [Corynebacterium kroppenstedtii]MDU7287598.1 tRNA pseudouridine(55) synthase TruB [Corynebacterium kroppenstedtii]
MTSHDVVSAMRRLMRTRKVGHAGTLDPAATGVLILGIERGTKFMTHLVANTKSYDATIRLGFATTTDDAEGDPIPYPDDSEGNSGQTTERPLISPTTRERLSVLLSKPERIDRAREQLTGDIMQRPSSVSAIKVDGRRAYDRVRSGKEVSLPPRPVTVSTFDIRDMRTTTIYNGDEGVTVIDLDVTVDCSSGTYIRALARDLGELLGVGGHLTALRRTRVGSFGLDDAKTLDQLRDEQSLAEQRIRDEQVTGEIPRASLSYSLDQAITRSFPIRHLSDDEASAVSMGKRIPASDLKDAYAGVSADGHAIALLKNEGKIAKTVFVARPATLS